MQFSTRRVALQGYTGVIRRVHPQEANRMIICGQAEFVDARSIRVIAGFLVPRGTQSTENSCVTTRRERMPTGGVLIQHKRINKDDAPVYRMAVTDCLR